MDTMANSLQDKIQKLIDQYTQDKASLARLEEQNADLTEENRQLMAQIEGFDASQAGSATHIVELEQRIKDLETQNSELQKAIAGFESIASLALDKIDKAFPDLVSTGKK